MVDMVEKNEEKMTTYQSEEKMMSYQSDIQLGETYKDKLTGVFGVATSLHFYRNACERVILTYERKGQVIDASFDAMDLVHLDSGKEVTTSRPGGPDRAMPPRR